MAKRGAVTAEAETDDTESVDSANERDMEALREAEKPQKREADDDEPPLEFAEAGEEDDDGEPAQPVERPSRRERRGNRYREAQEAKERAEQTAAALTQRLAALEQQLRQGAPAPQQGPGEVENLEGAYADNQRRQLRLSQDYDRELRALQYQDPQTGRWMQRKMAEEDEQRFLAESRALQLEAQEIATLRAAVKHGYRPAGQQESPVVTMLRAEYHDVEANPAAKAYARAYYQAQVAGGAPEGIALLKEALNYGRDWLGSGAGQPPRPGGKAPKPSKESQARFTGSARGASPARAAPTAQTTGRAVLPDGLTLKEFNKMADKMYPHIKDDAQRRTRYYRDCVEPEMRKGE